MTTLLAEHLSEHPGRGPLPPARPELRLVGRTGGSDQAADEAVDAARSRVLARRHRVSPEVRRRRALLAMMGSALALLALPLGGSGGASHTTGSASATPAHGRAYTVRPGDTLWSIAERADPTGDPRPIVSQLASELGTDTVVAGEQVTVP